jgi:hypothetical protein
MKSLIFTMILSLNLMAVNGQIFTQSTTDESITITPRGIQSKLTNNLAETNTGLGNSVLRNLNTGFKIIQHLVTMF